MSASFERATPVRVCFPFVGDKVGGSHVSALKLIQNMDRSAFEPVIAVQEADGPLASFLRRERTGFVTLPLPRMLTPADRGIGALAGYAGGTVPHLRSFLQQGRFEIVHTNDGRVHASWGVAARLAGLRLVWHHRGDPDARGANYLAPLIANHMVTVSRFARPSRPILPMEHRTSVVHSPFERPRPLPDRNFCKAALLAELEPPPETRTLGYFGNLVDRKRPLLFLDIVARMRRRHPEIPVVGCLFGASLPGGKNYEPLLRRYAEELGIADAIHLMGFRQPIEPYIAATDVLLIPSIGEPFGRTMIEGMFLGTPVVAVDHGGNPEAIEDGSTGYLVRPEDADAFVAPIARLLGDPDLFARIARRGQEHADRSFGVEGHVQRIAAIYRRILRPTLRRGDAAMPDAAISR